MIVDWVAIVDDNPSIRTALGRLLRCNGIATISFSSAEEYLNRGLHAEPRCILLDVQLASGMSGFDLKERLEAEGTAPPIVFMTGRYETGLLLAALCGEACLRKPFQTDELIRCLRRHLPVDLRTVHR